jgi:Sec-independent protein translocase protein TatA
MPKYFIIFLLLLMLPGVRAQESWQQMMQYRDSLMVKIDTASEVVAVKKPAELRRENVQLREVIFFDTLLLQSMAGSIPPDTLIPGLIAQKNLLLKEKQDLQQELVVSLQQHLLARRYLNMLLIVSFILLVLAVVILVLWGRQRRKVKKLEEANGKFYTDMHALHSEIEKHQETQKQLATAINKSKKQHADELNALRREKEQATEEVLMLQNQMSAVKTAYDAEVEKRMELMLEIPNLAPDAEESFEVLSIEIAQLQKELSELKTKYENEIATRLMFEKEISNLLEKIKMNFGS